MADITDGLSTTMMVMETNFENGPWGAGGFPTVRGADPEGPDYLGYTGQFGSLHQTEETILFKVYPQCSNCLFVDGSVHLLVKPVDSKVFEALATIAGGEKVELPSDY
jgi:prepilin-type processing-associated H-X9-DG protein